MILRSGKVAIKKTPKHSSANEIKQEEEYEGEDIISKLPDELLTNLLSLLPDADAYRTTILSNRWNDLRLFLPNLHFVMPRGQPIRFIVSVVTTPDEKVNNFYNSVDQTLALRVGTGMPIQRFFLDCSDNKCDYTRVYDWLCTAVKCRVQELDLSFPSYGGNVRLCWDLFRTCNTLVALTLKGQLTLDVPEAELHFPCLKKMNIGFSEYSSEKQHLLIMNLISGCPVLQELFLERIESRIFRMHNSEHTVKVSSQSLSKITISPCFFVFSVVVIDAPKLEYLHIMNSLQAKYSLMNPMSFVQPQIDRVDAARQFIICVSSAKILTLINDSLWALERLQFYNLPMFPNLVKLVISWGGNWLPILLNSMPNLEHLTFSSGLLPCGIKWNPTMNEAPGCLRFKIKEIFILSQRSLQWKEVAVIRYLLTYSNVLEKLRIHTHKLLDPKRRRHVLNIYRSSESCQIEFVENSSRSHC